MIKMRKMDFPTLSIFIITILSFILLNIKNDFQQIGFMIMALVSLYFAVFYIRKITQH